MGESKEDFRDLINLVLRGYLEAWEFCREIPNIDNIIDEIASMATERLEALAMEDNAGNPAFWNDEGEMESVVSGYVNDYYSTGYVELCQSAHTLLNSLKLTYISYCEDGNATISGDSEYKINAAQNHLFDFSTFYAGFIDV